jgi:pectate lyase
VKLVVSWVILVLKRNLSLVWLLGTVLPHGLGSAVAQDVPPFLVDAGPQTECRDVAVVERHGTALAWPLLESMTGFARAAGVTGGLGKSILTVTSVFDVMLPKGVQPAAGSLREMVEKARRTGGGWIVFAPSLGVSPRINLQGALRLPSNLTIDGGCSGVVIAGADGASALSVLTRADNVILTRLHLEKTGLSDPKTDGDCITVGQFSDRIWIAYNAMQSCGDGMIDITQSRPGDSPTRVTVAFNRFADHDKTMLIAAMKCVRPGVAPAGCFDELDRGWDWARGTQVTLQGNIFLRTGQRHPRLYGSSYLHMLDNVIAFRPFQRTDGTMGASSGTFVGGGARALVENNLYIPLVPNRRNFGVASAETPGVSHDPNEGRGAMRVLSNRVMGEAVIDQRYSELVPAPPYVLVPKRAFGTDPERAARCSLALSGPRAAGQTSPAGCQPTSAP